MSTILRFLATADLQMHAWKQFSYIRPDGINSRLYNCGKVLDIVIKEAKKRGIGKFLIAGDFFEESDFINVETYDYGFRKLEHIADAGIDTVLLVGNHDIALSSPERVVHSLRPFRKTAKIVDAPKTVWTHLSCVPYMSSIEDIKEGVRRFAKSATDIPNALVLHAGVQGARTGPEKTLIRNPLRLKDIRPDEFSIVLLGDYHTHQWLSKNVMYLGSPLQHTFGETHRPCIWDVSLLDKEPWFHLEKIYTDLPRFRRVSAGNRRELRKRTEDFASDYVSVRISPSSKLEEDDVEKVSKEIGFRYRIEREREEGSKDFEAKSLDAKEYISKYANSNSRRGHDRLIAVGNRLYTEE